MAHNILAWTNIKYVFSSQTKKQGLPTANIGRCPASLVTSNVTSISAVSSLKMKKCYFFDSLSFVLRRTLQCICRQHVRVKFLTQRCLRHLSVYEQPSRYLLMRNEKWEMSRGIAYFVEPLNSKKLYFCETTKTRATAREDDKYSRGTREKKSFYFW